MLDRKGVIHTRRDDINKYKQLFANNTDKRTLEDVIEGADLFVGVSGPDLLSPEALKLMANKLSCLLAQIQIQRLTQRWRTKSGVI